MLEPVFVGVDGGATKSVLRLEDEAGNLLGQTLSGPASVRVSPDLAWHSINVALDKLLAPLALSRQQLHIGMGLAGCEVEEAYYSFINKNHHFKTLLVSSDSHIACLGAHRGQDGAIIIAGTGVVGYQIHKGEKKQVGGWGFPHDDEGGGAWLGMQAIRKTFKWLDGRETKSGLSQAVFAYFDHEPKKMISWANRANSTLFAELAPLVVEQSQQGDGVAEGLLKRAAEAIDHIAQALAQAEGMDRQVPYSLLGGMAPFIIPFLSDTLRKQLKPQANTPVVGAVYLIREHLKMQANYG